MEKAQAHRLLDQLDPDQFDAVSRLLEVMADPVCRALAAAPADDEPVTKQDRRRFHDGQASFANNGGKGRRLDDLVAGAGIEPGDLRSEQIDAGPLRDEDRRAISGSREYFRQNQAQIVSFEELATECGFTVNQIRDHKD